MPRVAPSSAAAASALPESVVAQVAVVAQVTVVAQATVTAQAWLAGHAAEHAAARARRH